LALELLRNPTPVGGFSSGDRFFSLSKSPHVLRTLLESVTRRGGSCLFPHFQLLAFLRQRGHLPLDRGARDRRWPTQHSLLLLESLFETEEALLEVHLLSLSCVLDLSQSLEALLRQPASLVLFSHEVLRPCSCPSVETQSGGCLSLPLEVQVSRDLDELVAAELDAVLEPPPESVINGFHVLQALMVLLASKLVESLCFTS
jgi:hypothetical protein